MRPGKTSRRDEMGFMGIRPRPQLPKCPRGLHPIAKREWKRVTPALDRLGLLTEVDGAALEGYCAAYALMVVASETIAREGQTYQTQTGYLRQHPAVGIFFEAAVAVRAFCGLFGMSPKARAQMQIPEPDVEDEMDAFLRGE